MRRGDCNEEGEGDVDGDDYDDEEEEEAERPLRCGAENSFAMIRRRCVAS